MIEFLIKLTISLTVFLSFYHLVLEREKMHQFNRFYLLISVVISLTIPFITYEIIEIIPVVENLKSLDSETTPKTFDENTVQESVIPLQESINYIPYLIWSFYGITTFLLLIRFGKNCLKLISKSKSNPIVKYKNANLVLITEKTLPHTFLNSIFINFDDYNNRNIEDELYTHELVHVNQKHTLDILFIELLKVLFWFNPLFIFYKKAIQLNHEFLADEEIVKTYNDIPFYQNLLLQKSFDNQTIYLTSNLNYLVTKKRLLMMTKSTSQKISLFKKIAIVPILAGLIYFFCIEIVAQEKVIPLKSETKNSETTDKDKIRDSYYSSVRIILKDLRTNVTINKMYEELSSEEKKRYLNWVPDIMIEKEIPHSLFEKMKTKNMAVWINGKTTSKEEIQKYKRTDFSYYTYSFVHINARSKRFPQEYQYTLYTKKYFDENLKNSHLHFSNDTLKMVVSNYDKATKKVSKILSPKGITADTVVWQTKGKDGYNLYLNDKKKNKKTIVIDAGHGGKDTGTEVDHELESNIVASIAKKISLLNSKDEIEIILLREDDRFIGLNERVNAINKINPSLLISLHLNSSKNSEDNGVNAFVSKQNNFYEKSVDNAKDLIDIISNDKLSKGEVKDANLFIIHKSKCPAVLLEIGYLSNKNDKTYITSEKGKNEIANRIFEFIKQ